MFVDGRMRFLLLALIVASAACGKIDTRFESVCQIVRRDAVETNQSGVIEVLDVELEWDPCPGDQFQVLRGGRDFASCMARYENGVRVPVLVKQWWDPRGYNTWDIYRVGDCPRTIEPDSEGSYEKSQECRDKLMYGSLAGFSCSRRPFAELVAVCPWMARD